MISEKFTFFQITVLIVLEICHCLFHETVLFVMGFFCLTLCFQEDLTKETLLKQFKIVKSHTNTSHVQQYGNRVRE